MTAGWTAIHRALDEGRDPLADAGVRRFLATDPDALEAFARLHANLHDVRAAPLARRRGSRPLRQLRQPVAIAAAVIATIIIGSGIIGSGIVGSGALGEATVASRTSPSVRVLHFDVRWRHADAAHHQARTARDTVRSVTRPHPVDLGAVRHFRVSIRRALDHAPAARPTETRP